jgi:hypothetical protein
MRRNPIHALVVLCITPRNLGLKTVTAMDRKKPVANKFELCKGMLDHVSYALYDKVEYSLFGEPK